MPETFSKTASWMMIFCVYCLPEALAQQPRLEDIPPANPSQSTIRSLPIDSSLRTSLEVAIKSRDYNHAETLLAKEVERNPKNSALLTFLGRILFLDGKYLVCAIAMKKADRLTPLDNRSRFTLALSYVIMGHADWARPELVKLTRSDPQNSLYVYWLGRIQYKGQEYEDAIKNFKKALSLDPNFAKGYDNLGLCYEAVGRLDEAIDIYGKAVGMNRQRETPSPWPPLNLASLLVRIGKLEEAEALLQESLKYDPRFPKAHYQMGVLLEKEKKDGAASHELDEAVRFDPSYAEPHYVLARIYQRTGDGEKARNEQRIFQKLKTENSKGGPQ